MKQQDDAFWERIMNRPKTEADKVKEAIRAALIPLDLPVDDVFSIQDKIMEAVTDNYRSLTEVQSIVDCVRSGQRVHVDYWDPEDEESMDPLANPCW
ncbi:MAG: hypothetical protein LUD50_03035 [Clostridia bacterium]|nr:hypothetical protein [Clostridia bacterium]